MGLFGGKIRTVSSSTMNLASAGVDPLVDAILLAIMEEKGIPEEILKTLINGMALKMRRVMRYAASDYTLGVPQGQTVTLPDYDTDDITDAIKNDTSFVDEVVIDSYSVVNMTPAFALLPTLESKYGYDVTTNLLLSPPADFVPPVICYRYLEQGNDTTPQTPTCLEWGPDLAEHRVVVTSIVPSDDNLTALVTYEMQFYRQHEEDIGGETEETIVWSTWESEGHIYSETLDVPNSTTFIFGEKYLYVRYKQCDPLGNELPTVLSWYYYLNAMTYTKLSPTEDHEVHDTYCPIVPIRYSNVDLTADSLSNTPLYITSKKLLNKASIDFLDLGSKINSNPDAAEIDHAYVLWGINLQNSYSASLQYLGDYFETLYSLQQNDKVNYINELLNGDVASGNTYRTQPVSKASFLEHGLNYTVNFDYIDVKTEIGVIPKITRRKIRIGDSTKQFIEYEVIKSNPIARHNQPDRFFMRSARILRIQEAKVIIRTQIGKRRIRKVTVYGLSTRNLIYHGLSVDTTTLMVKNNSEENNLFLPIQFNTAEKLRLPSRNLMYTDASLMVINTWQVTKLKWYQSKLFFFIMIIVCIIIVYYTGQTWVFYALSALEAGVMALIIYLVLTIVIGIAINYLVDWIVANVGEELAMILMLVVLVIALIAGRFDATITIMQTFMLSVSQVMLQIATAIVSAVNEFLIEEGEKIRNEYLDFEARLADRWDDLNTAKDLLPEYNDIYNPIKYAAASRFRMMPSETPDGFMQRCLGLADNSMFIIHGQISNRCMTLMYVSKGVSPQLYNQNLHA